MNQLVKEEIDRRENKKNQTKQIALGPAEVPSSEKKFSIDNRMI